jgi:hypothetical protein
MNLSRKFNYMYSSLCTEDVKSTPNSRNNVSVILQYLLTVCEWVIVLIVGIVKVNSSIGCWPTSATDSATQG